MSTTTTKRTAPSRVARRLAGDLWPDVQDQRKVAPGVFGFSCAGHGGIVAVLDAAEFEREDVERARDLRKTELVAIRPRRMLTTATYTPESLREWGRRGELYECWVGEEDCDWALLAYADDRIRTGGIDAGYFAATLTAADVLESVYSWNPGWLGIDPPRPQLGPGEAFLRTAWGDWHDAVPAGMVGVAVENGAGVGRVGLVPRAAYEAAENRGEHILTRERVIDTTELAELPADAF